MASRHIPNNIDKEVKNRHYFECAWCGVKLTERHHIIEFSQGGEHSIENLILLCPNCHTQVHSNEITVQELMMRKSTHVKGDRISGGVQFDINEPTIVILGNARFKEVPILLQYKKEPIIELRIKDNLYYLTTRFYNKDGDLIFWMSSDRYWTLSEFNIRSSKQELIITNPNDENTRLRIWKVNGYLNIEGRNYLNGMIVDFNPKYVKVGGRAMGVFNAIKCPIGINID